MTARTSMASSPAAAFKAMKPKIPYDAGLELIITAHNPTLPEPKSISHTLRSLRERLVATPLERCLNNPPAEGIPFCTNPFQPFASSEQTNDASAILTLAQTDHAIASDQEKPPTASSTSADPLSHVGDSTIFQTSELASQIAGISSAQSTLGDTSPVAADCSNNTSPCRVALKITSQVRVRDGGNSQVVLACITSVEGRPSCQWQLPVGDTVEVVAKLYDPLFANHEHPEHDPFAAADNDYRTEVAAYHRLQPLQGTTIPRFYGSYTVDIPFNSEHLPPSVQDTTPAPATPSKRFQKKGSTEEPPTAQPRSETTSPLVFQTRPVRLILLQEIINADHLTGIMLPRALRMPRRRLILSSILAAWETMYYNFGLCYRSLHPTNVLQAENQGEGLQLMTPRKKKKKSKSSGGVPMGIVIIDFTNVSLGPTWPLWSFGRDESWWKEFSDDWNWLWLGDWPWDEWMQSRYGEIPLEDRKIGKWVPIHYSEKVIDSNAEGTPLITKDSLRGRGSSSSFGRPSIDLDGIEITFATSRDTSVVPSIEATVSSIEHEGRVEQEQNLLTPSKASKLKSTDRHRTGGRFIKSPKDSKRSNEIGKRLSGKLPMSRDATNVVGRLDFDGDLPMVDAAEMGGRSSDEDYEDVSDDEDEGEIE